MSSKIHVTLCVPARPNEAAKVRIKDGKETTLFYSVSSELSHRRAMELAPKLLGEHYWQKQRIAN